MYTCGNLFLLPAPTKQYMPACFMAHPLYVCIYTCFFFTAYSTAALEAFLYRNKLSHVIRAHEVKSTGFQVNLTGFLLTCTVYFLHPA